MMPDPDAEQITILKRIQDRLETCAQQLACLCLLGGVGRGAWMLQLAGAACVALRSMRSSQRSRQTFFHLQPCGPCVPCCRAGMAQPSIEVRYEGLCVETTASVGSKHIPTVARTVTNSFKVSRPVCSRGGSCGRSCGAAEGGLQRG